MTAQQPPETISSTIWLAMNRKTPSLRVKLPPNTNPTHKKTSERITINDDDPKIELVDHANDKPNNLNVEGRDPDPPIKVRISKIANGNNKNNLKIGDIIFAVGADNVEYSNWLDFPPLPDNNVTTEPLKANRIEEGSQIKSIKQYAALDPGFDTGYTAGNNPADPLVWWKSQPFTIKLDLIRKRFAESKSGDAPLSFIIFRKNDNDDDSDDESESESETESEIDATATAAAAADAADAASSGSSKKKKKSNEKKKSKEPPAAGADVVAAGMRRKKTRFRLSALITAGNNENIHLLQEAPKTSDEIEKYDAEVEKYTLMLNSMPTEEETIDKTFAAVVAAIDLADDDGVTQAALVKKLEEAFPGEEAQEVKIENLSKMTNDQVFNALDSIIDRAGASRLVWAAGSALGDQGQSKKLARAKLARAKLREKQAGGKRSRKRLRKKRRVTKKKRRRSRKTKKKQKKCRPKKRAYTRKR